MPPCENGKKNVLVFICEVVKCNRLLSVICFITKSYITNVYCFIEKSQDIGFFKDPPLSPPSKSIMNIFLFRIMTCVSVKKTVSSLSLKLEVSKTMKHVIFHRFFVLIFFFIGCK